MAETEPQRGKKESELGAKDTEKLEFEDRLLSSVETYVSPLGSMREVNTGREEVVRAVLMGTNFLKFDLHLMPHETEDKVIHTVIARKRQPFEFKTASPIAKK